MSTPRASIVIPAYNEDESIGRTLATLVDAVTIDHEILLVVDNADDKTVHVAEPLLRSHPRGRILVQDYGTGPANAIRYGFDHAASPCVVVTMADGSDDVRIIDDLVRLVERGFVIAAASRYVAGGAQVGGPLLKRTFSEFAGRTLYWFARVGTHDATNSFKAYQSAFVQTVGIASRDGFEIGIELVAKARRTRQPVAELPTIWLDRNAGVSRFQVGKWLPKYLFWYRFAFGPPILLERITTENDAMKGRMVCE